MAYFWLSNYLTDIVSAFLATGILKLEGLNGKPGWRYLFLIEGCLTLFIGILSFFLLPPGPTQTKAWYRPNGWFTERFGYYTTVRDLCWLKIQGRDYYGQQVRLVGLLSESVVVDASYHSRVLRDDPSKSDMHNRQGLSIRMIWEALCDWKMWPLYCLGLTHQSNWTNLFRYATNTNNIYSPHWSAPNLSHALSSEPWIQHDSNEPFDNPFKFPRAIKYDNDDLFERDVK